MISTKSIGSAADIVGTPVFACGSLHRVSRISLILGQAEGALRPGLAMCGTGAACRPFSKHIGGISQETEHTWWFVDEHQPLIRLSPKRTLQHVLIERAASGAAPVWEPPTHAFSRSLLQGSSWEYRLACSQFFADRREPLRSDDTR